MPTDRTKKRTAMAAAAATAAIAPAAIPLATPDTAAAAPPPYCGGGLCLYRDAGFSGSIAYFSGDDDNYAAHGPYAANTFVNGEPLDEHVSAVWNHTPNWLMLCTSAVSASCGYFGSGGHILCVGPEVALSDLRFVAERVNFNDSISSHAFLPNQPVTCDAVWNRPYGCSL